jgi:hypothetical protein
MGKRSRNFKLSKRKKEKYVKKQKYDYSKFDGRIIGCLPDGYPILGSKSQLINQFANESAPFEANDIREREYIDLEMATFKKYMSDSDISMW